MRKLLFSLTVIFCVQFSVFAQHGQRDTEPTVPPFKIFDNLYYVGMGWVSSYLLTTSDGLILIDALYGEFPKHIIQSVKDLGFDPKDIKYILCTHGHYDHNEGAEMLQKLTGARVGMTDLDWKMTEGVIENPYPMVNAKLTRDLVLHDKETLTLGNTTLTFYVTPGHTPGVLSMSFKVKDSGKEYNAFVFGGAGLNFEGVKRTEMYLSSLDRLLSMPELLEVNIPNHPSMGQILERGEKLKGRKSGDPHPFVAREDYISYLKDLHRQGEEKLIEEKKKGNK